MEHEVGVRFGNYHTWEDFQMYLKETYIGEAIEKAMETDIPGRDGDLNLSNFFGYPVYQNRMLRFEFEAEDGGYPGYYTLSSQLKNALQGEEKKIIQDEDNEFYWIGKASVDVQKKNSIISSVVITCSVNPYKYKRNKTVVSKRISGQEEINCINIQKRVVPVITADSEFRLIMDNVSVAVPAGTTIVPDLLLKSGDNFILCNGNGTISFEYQEGSL